MELLIITAAITSFLFIISYNKDQDRRSRNLKAIGIFTLSFSYFMWFYSTEERVEYTALHSFTNPTLNVEIQVFFTEQGTPVQVQPIYNTQKTTVEVTYKRPGSIKTPKFTYKLLSSK